MSWALSVNISRNCIKSLEEKLRILPYVINTVIIIYLRFFTFTEYHGSHYEINTS
jgi:hypothetical protein